MCILYNTAWNYPPTLRWDNPTLQDYQRLKRLLCLN